jgi:hypothetical protein
MSLGVELLDPATSACEVMLQVRNAIFAKTDSKRSQIQ